MPASGSPWTITPPRPSAPRETVPCTSARAWCATAWRRGWSRPATRARAWPPPRWCRAWCRAWTGPRWPAFSRPTKARRWWWWTWAPTWIASRAMLAQFAVMGEIYSRARAARSKRPRVGLLSIGEEEHKGNELTRAATPLLKELDLNFIGNVEGRDIYAGNVDVIVCDGFIGNVALKVSEGLADMVKHDAAGIAAKPPSPARSATCCRGRLQRVQEAPGLLRIRRRAAAGRAAACASSATAVRTPTPSRMPSAWPRNLHPARSISASKKSCANRQLLKAGRVNVACVQIDRLLLALLSLLLPRCAVRADREVQSRAVETHARPGDGRARRHGAGEADGEDRTRMASSIRLRRRQARFPPRSRLSTARPSTGCTISNRRRSASSTRISTRTPRPTKARRSFLLGIAAEEGCPRRGRSTVRFEPRYQTCSGTSCMPPRTPAVTCALTVDRGAPAAAVAIPAGLHRSETRGGERGRAQPRRRHSGLAAHFWLVAFGFGLAASSRRACSR